MRFVKIMGPFGPNPVGPFTATDPGGTIAGTKRDVLIR